MPSSICHHQDYGKAQFDLINKAIEKFDWNKLFSGQDIHNQVSLFNTTILNIFRNFIPNKVTLCDDKETPIRMLKLCSSSVSKPLFLLFKHSLENKYCQFTKKAISS